MTTHMSRLPFEVSVAEVDGTLVYQVPGPNMLREKTVPLIPDGAEMLGKRFGRVPGRSSLFRWRSDGYPVDPSGPRVKLPTVTKLKQVHTSVEALRRFFLCVSALSQDISASGGLKNWTPSEEAMNCGE